MVSKKIAQALAGSSVIRAMFNEGKEMAARYGAENVYDFSLGNPATPAPESVNRTIKEIVNEMDPLECQKGNGRESEPEIPDFL